jgi:heavy metal sensor kinase
VGVVISAYGVSVYVRAGELAERATRQNLKLRADTLSGILELSPEGIELDLPPELIAEYDRPGSGAFFVYWAPGDIAFTKSMSLGEEKLPEPPPWREGGAEYREIEAGPGGNPCAILDVAFLARVESEEEGEERAWTPPAGEARHFRLQVGLDIRERNERLAGLGLFLCLAGGAALLLTLGGGLLLARRLLRPVRRMTEEAARLTPEDSERRLGPDTVVAELNELAQTLNSALDRLGAALERQRRFTADASHQLRTPVSALLGNTELLLRRPRTPEEYRAGLERQKRVAERLRDVTEELLLLARADAGGEGVEKQTVVLAEVVASVCEEARALAEAAGVEIRCATDPTITVHGNPGYLVQMGANLLSNAIKFSPPKGRVDVTLGANGKRVFLSVTDQGPGIPPEARKAVFERFFRVHEGKDTREGTGLGLAIAAWIARLHGGEITVEGEDGQGATLRVALPRSPG